MTIDDAGWHEDSVAELGLDPSAAAIHIGVFLAWAGSRGWLARNHEDAIRAGRLRSETPSAYADRFFVGEFGAWDLTEQGQAFAANAYSSYLRGIHEAPLLAAAFDSAYEAPDDWETYDLWSQFLEQLYSEWLAR